MTTKIKASNIDTAATDFTFGTMSVDGNLTVTGGNIQVDFLSRKIGYKLSGNSNAGYLVPYDTSGYTSLVNERSTGAILFKTGVALDERVRIDSSGNVGIGTTSPASTLHLQAAANSDTTLTVTGGVTAGAGSNAYIKLIPDGTSGAGIINIDGSDGSDVFQIKQSNSTRLTIDSSGNVGIGTSSPAAKLQITTATAGTTAATVAAGTNAGIYLEDNATPSANYFVSKIHNPGNSLDVGGIKFVVSPDGANYNWSGIKALTTTSGNAGVLAFYISGGNTSGDASTERMRINATGIDVTGTVVADGLTVESTVVGNIASFINDGSSTNSKGIKIQGGTDNGFGENYKIEFFDGDGTASGRISTNTGLIFIEAAPVVINNAGGDYDFRVASVTNANALFVQGSDGNVGIGTSTPTGKLNVIGTTNLSAKLTIGTFGDRVRNFEVYGSDALFDAGNGAFDLLIGDGGFAYMSLHTTDNATALKIRNHTGNSDLVTFERVSGNVGIGTSSPSEKLHVQGDGADILLTDAAGGQTAKLGSTGSNNGLLELNNSAHTGTVFLNSSGDSYLNGGNVGIGTPSPSTKLDIDYSHTNTTISSPANAALRLQNTNAGADNYLTALSFTTSTTGVGTDSVIASISESAGNSALTFWTDTSNGMSEKVRIDSSGSLYQGYNTGGFAGGACIKAIGYNIKQGFSGALGASIFNIDWSTGTAKLWIDTTNVGTITLTSDYRIKQDVETQTEAGLSRIMALRPVTYQHTDFGTLFKADGITREGFIAHELQEVIPSAVEGEKDAENQIQSLKIDALCAVMVKAIQEQQAIITALETRLSILEGA